MATRVEAIASSALPSKVRSAVEEEGGVSKRVKLEVDDSVYVQETKPIIPVKCAVPGVTSVEPPSCAPSPTPPAPPPIPSAPPVFTLEAKLRDLHAEVIESEAICKTQGAISAAARVRLAAAIQVEETILNDAATAYREAANATSRARMEMKKVQKLEKERQKLQRRLKEIEVLAQGGVKK